MAGTIGREMAASYTISITGLASTRSKIEHIDALIRELRVGSYTAATNVTVASSLGTKDLFVTEFDELTGRVQTKVQDIMLEGMDRGIQYQTFALSRATTPYGRSGKGRNPAGRNGPGRDDTGDMINALQRNVEVLKTKSVTVITGFHGWSTEERRYFPYQEKGTGGSGDGNGVPAANSLGQAIVPVREFLTEKLNGLRL